MNIGPLNVEDIDRAYFVIVQLRHQPAGVLHSVILRPDKVKQTMRQCSMGHSHKSAVIVFGESAGDQAAGWQYPENVYVVAVLGIAHPSTEPVSQATPWECKPLE